MIQALPKTKSVTFEEFVEWKPEGKYYELHHGVIIEMAQPLGDHEDITGFLAERATAEYLRLNLPYRILKTVLVKPPENQSAYSPDVLIINRPNLINEPLWKQQSTLIQGASIPLVIEVVSTNWRVDYLTKVKDYEEIGIPEYWIVDYLAIGSRDYLGDPKLPSVLIFTLDTEGKYQMTIFQNSDRIVSPTFPELNLTVEQIMAA